MTQRFRKKLAPLGCVLVAGLAGPLAGQEQPAAQLLTEAAQALESGDLDSAERAFAEAAALAPTSTQPLLGLSDVREQKGELFEALEAARAARRVAPEDALAAFWVGKLLGRLGAVSEALASLEEARTLDPRLPEAYVLAALLLRDRGKHDTAMALLDEAHALDLDSSVVSEQLSFLLLTQGEPARAREVASEALVREPDRPGLKLALGLALAKEPSQHERALQLLLEALEAGAAKPGRLHLELGSLLFEMQRVQEALPHLRRAVELQPDSSRAHYQLGVALRRGGELEAAQRSLRRFQELSRQEDEQEWQLKKVGTELNAAQRLAFENRLHEALARVDALLAEHPEEARAHALRAKLVSSLGRDSAALDNARRARELAPEMVEYHYLEGLFLVRLGEPRAAEACLARALAVDEGSAPVHELMGIVAFNADRHEAAQRHLSRALALGSDSADVRKRLAASLRALGRPGEAERILAQP